MFSQGANYTSKVLLPGYVTTQGWRCNNYVWNLSPGICATAAQAKTWLVNIHALWKSSKAPRVSSFLLTCLVILQQRLVAENVNSRSSYLTHNIEQAGAPLTHIFLQNSGIIQTFTANKVLTLTRSNAAEHDTSLPGTVVHWQFQPTSGLHMMVTWEAQQATRTSIPSSIEQLKDLEEQIDDVQVQGD